MKRLWPWCLATLALAGAASAHADVVVPQPYDLLYVRAPYFGPSGRNSVWPDTVRPLAPDPGAQLALLKRDGSREVLFPLERYRGQIDTPAGTPLAAGSVADPNVSFDGRSVLFTWYHDLTRVNVQRGTRGRGCRAPVPTSTSSTWRRAGSSASRRRRSPPTPATAPASRRTTRRATTRASASSTPAAPGRPAAASSSPRHATTSCLPRR